MAKLRVESFSISIDGFAAGPDQSLENPLGIGGTALHGWAFATRTFQTLVLAAMVVRRASTTTSQRAAFDHGEKHVWPGARPLAR